MMKSLAIIVFSVIAIVMTLSAQGSQANLEPDVPFCGRISSSSSSYSSDSYFIDIAPKTSELTLFLRWSSDASSDSGPLGLAIHSPDGKETGPEEARDPVQGKTYRSYAFAHPKAGRWTVEVLPVGPPAMDVDYCLSFNSRLDEDVLAARFNGLYRWSGEDEDGDGLNDHVVLKIGLSVKKAGNYSLQGSMHDQNGGSVTPFYNDVSLGFGSQFAELYLPGMETPGPYLVTDMVLYDESGEILDRSSSGYVARENLDLPLSGTETVGARLNGAYSDIGSDADGDGFFDYLTVDAGMDVLVTGNYSIMGFLYDTSGRELVWSMNSGEFEAGLHTIHMDFDGKTLWGSRANGPYRLGNLSIFSGDSVQNMTPVDSAHIAYTTGFYNFTQFTDPIWPEKTLSGSGSGDILLTISIESIMPVFRGRYSCDIVGVQMPPISSNWTVTGSKNGYAYDLPGIHMPGEPNNFSIIARGVKNLGVGVRKEQSTKSGNGNEMFRTWISSQAKAGEDGSAVLENDLISPGKYHFKIFGDAADNTTQVVLELKVTKRLIIDGNFDFALDTGGLPKGNYSISMQALNGNIRLDEVALKGSDLGF